MIPFQPNKQQLEAIRNGATKLWIPIITQDNGYSYDVQPQDCRLQPDNQCFVQEEFWCIEGAVFYTADCDMKSIKENDIDNEMTPQPADQMTKSQSRYKFTVTGVEVKNVNKINLVEWLALCQSSKLDFEENGWTLFKQWHDSQYPDKPYNTKPTGFLITIKE